jgi:hypothetical protein
METTFDLNVASDRHEVFAYAAEPWSDALGTTTLDTNAGGAFGATPGSQLNLHTFDPQTSENPINFGERQWDHSAEFNGTNAVRRYY